MAGLDLSGGVATRDDGKCGRPANTPAQAAELRGQSGLHPLFTLSHVYVLATCARGENTVLAMNAVEMAVLSPQRSRRNTYALHPRCSSACSASSRSPLWPSRCRTGTGECGNHKNR